MERTALHDALMSLQHVGETGMLPESFAGNHPQASASITIAGRTAIIPITGTIRPTPDVFTRYLGGTACSEMRSSLAAAAGNPEIDQIVLAVDSPGGSAIGLEETAQAIFALRGTKRVVAAVTAVCASAAYYLASAAETIVASPSATVGSIGSVIIHASWEKALSDFGLQITEITHGQHKTDGSPYRALDKQGKASLQEFVDAYGDQFVAAVARHRGITTADVSARFGSGKMFIASEALSRGMIDLVQSIDGLLSGQPLTQSSAVTVTAQHTAAAAQPPAAAQPTEGDPNVDRIKALLFGLGCIAALNATDAEATAALTAFCRARGGDVPRSDDGLVDEAAAIAILTARSNATPATVATSSATGSAAATPGNGNASGDAAVQAAADRERAELREQIAAELRGRRDEIQAIANLINSAAGTPLIGADVVQSAVDSEHSVAQIREQFNAIVESRNNPLSTPPVTSPVGVSMTQSGHDVFARDAVEVLFDRVCQMRPDLRVGQTSERELNPDLRNMSLRRMALTSLQLAGNRSYNEDSAPEEMFRAALNMSSESQVPSVYSASPAYNRPGDFPNLLSNLAGKILDATIRSARVTYQQWAQRLDDAADFKASPIVAIGTFTTLDDIVDGHEANELPMSEEYKGAIRVLRKGNVVKFTPIMAANDDLDAFAQALMTLAEAHELALNMMCLDKLAGNPTLADGVTLFHNSHGNLVSSGGAPSSAQATAMKKLLRLQTGVGNNTVIGGMLDRVLVPAEHEEPALQTFVPLAALGEMKQPTTDSNINVHRSTNVQVVIDAHLDAYSSNSWYGFDSRLRTIVYQFMRGYGQGGRRTNWFDPSTGCRHYMLEGRFGAAAVGYRGVVKNPGA